MKIIEITRVTLIEDGRPVLSRAVSRRIPAARLEEERSLLRASLIEAYTEGLQVDLRYKEMEEGR